MTQPTQKGALCAALLVAALAGCGRTGDGGENKSAEPPKSEVGKESKSRKGDPAQEKSAVFRDGDKIRVPDSSPVRAKLAIAPVEEQQVEQPIVAPGVVESDPAKVMKVFPPVSGRITQLYKRLGDPVKKGDALFALDSADLAQAYSDANKAQAALTLARRNLERQKELVAAEIVALKDLQQAESDHAQAESEDQRAKSRLAQLGAAAGDKRTGREYTLRSPIAGRVIELTGAQGGYWNDTNAGIMTVADLSTVFLTANVQEKDLASVFVGQSGKVALNAYASEIFEGKVRYVGEVLDPDTRTVKVRIGIDNPEGRFRPGMFARVTLAGRAHKAPVIPVSALLQSGFNTRVFVEMSPGGLSVARRKDRSASGRSGRNRFRPQRG